MKLIATLAAAVAAAGCTTSASVPRACSIAVTTTRQEASPVMIPPGLTYPGKRPAPAGGEPNIPINQPQIGC